MGNAIGKRVKPRTFRPKNRADTQDVLLPRLKIHPLFILLGVFYLFTGDAALFFVSAIVALQHEYAHAFASAKVGVRLNKVVLMPYGAVIDGGIDGASYGASYGASIDLDSLTDDERDEYESAYYSGLDQA